jgi:O-methyltransferase involved in polyketide biosynthesis
MRVRLDGVPETLLWTLRARAREAARTDTVLVDPLAVGLVEEIDFPFEERFGAPGAFGQWQALRAKAFDVEVRRFLAGHPGGTVVALGEGLETQFWRVDDGRVRWVTVELPEVVELRERLLPGSSRLRAIARSALDPAWMDEVDASRGVLLTAQGLLMYLQPEEVHRLIAACAERFPGGALVFDAVPRWFGERTQRGDLRTDGGYRPPPWFWGLDAGEEARLRALPGVGELRRVRLPRGRGVVHGVLLPLAASTPRLRDVLLSVLVAGFHHARRGAARRDAPADG